MRKLIKNLLEHNVSFIIAVSFTIIIAYLSLSKPINLNIPIQISYLDKIFHVIAYFGLTLSWLFIFKKKSKFKLVGIVIFFFGLLIELLQGTLTQTREQDLYDIIANSVGIVFAVIIFNNLYKYFIKIFDK